MNAAENPEFQIGEKYTGNNIEEGSYQGGIRPPYAVTYTFKQLVKIDIDPTFKVLLFYNLACCYQRLTLYDECVEYLEKAGDAL